MDSKRTYVYNVALRENDVCPQGELLTDKELERMKQHNPRRDWPKVAYVYLWTGSERINLTRMPKDERNKLLKQFNIPE